MNIAVIDLGTNTCNLIIAETNAHSFKRIFNDTYPVLLGTDGINQQIITPEAITRAKTAINNCLNIIKEFHVEKTLAFATSALRSAENGKDLALEIKKLFEIELHIISGDKEADYIYKGVKRSVPLSDKKVLILDIGGGSNEFIIANNDTIFWKRSYPIGMARIIEQFTLSDPYKEKEIRKLEEYFISELKDLFIAANKYKPDTLIGASGSFETFAHLLIGKNPNIKLRDEESGLLDIDINDYFLLHKEMINMNINERKKMKGMDTIRVEMIALASIFTNTIVKRINIKHIIKTDYSLKEGVLDSIANIR